LRSTANWLMGICRMKGMTELNLSAHAFKRICSSYLHKQWLQLLLIALVGIVAYSNTFNVPFVLDDNYSIDFFGTSRIMDLLLHGTSRRVADVTFALNYKIHGTQLPGYHVTNLAIHLAAACTLFFLARSALRSLCGTEEENESSFLTVFIPFASALLFVVHPVQTQAVTYTIQRYTSLSALFYLFSALTFIKSRCVFETGRDHQKSWLWAGVTLVSAVLALGSKQSAATLPVTLVVLEYVLFNGRLLNRRFFIVSGLLFMMMPLYLLYLWYVGTLGDFLFDLRHATADNIYMSRTTYFLTQTRVVVTYLRLLVFPINQNLFYDYPVYSSLLSGPVLASLALHSCLIIAAVILVRMSRDDMTTDRSQGACLRLAALGIAWFYITLAIESSFIPIRDVIFEHRLYLPSAGFFMTVTALTALAIRSRPARARTVWALLAISCLVLGATTIARNQVWGDALTLWQDTAKKSSNKGIVLINLAGEYLKRNMPEKALPLFVRGLEIDMSLSFREKIGIGASLKSLKVYGSRFSTGEEFIKPGGIFNSGVFDYSKASEWSGVIHNNLGLAYEYLMEPGKALQAYQTALTLNPTYDLAWYNLALLASKRGDTALVAEAIERLKPLNPPLAKALESSPHH